ncbi:histidine phosphatase family protein [Pseudodesulfovibrio sp. JC047]|uniref:histidine phosphatase family protein n=1 Tax=Pseudodesulfovibrio sp. JC047 TaxID=2683199 RepID=UPI0013D86DEA|nr:histidine phosphatase family protein [Pseudodesulfovibrio sp. JC047]NDV19951.1 histidine phosphatase family protein [Pseudodesulfovibrio sp. JC047]
MTTYFCMRHGLTDWNKASRIQGIQDTSLNDEGREMARKWAKTLAQGNFECIVTSSLDRAKETAAIINETLKVPMFEDSRLGEQDWGDWTGLDNTDLQKIKKQVKKQEYKGFEFRPPHGESRNDVLMRACDALIDFSEDHPDVAVLVVTHSCVLKSLVYALSGLEFMPNEPLPIKPYHLHRIECLDNELAPGQFNMEL